MADMKWTSDQQKVIDLRNRNILVSAAAGSGKTAVLVERIISMITDANNPVDIDRLLIVTFTNAAASEMRERIGKAIEKRIAEDPDNSHLHKQMTLIHSAQITTIHSFCLHVIRNHFHAIDLDPAFRIADEAELKLLKSDVITELLEEKYEEASPDFLHFIESYAVGKSDQMVEELILQLYAFSMSYPWPIEWLQEQTKNFEIENEEQMEEADWMKGLLSYIRSILADLTVRVQEAKSICANEDGPYMYMDALMDDEDLINGLIACKSYQALAEGFSNLSYTRLSAKKDVAVAEEKKDMVKAIREDIKKSLKDIQKSYFYQSKEQVLSTLMKVKESMETLILLTVEFSERFAKEKEEKNLVDFNDLEHFALKILGSRGEDGSFVESAIAREMSEHYIEILIDEYQDSNLVQEYILNSISTEKQGKPNVFMVGDVKQSIYKFRLARPELFMDKFNRYSLEDSSYQRIDLHKNFRSRGSVLNCINFIFEQIMTKELGNIVYDEEASLHVGANFPQTEENVGTTTEFILVTDEEVPVDEDKAKKESTTSLDDVDSESSENEDSLQAEYSSRELEARAIALRIKELLDPKEGMMVLDGKTYRKATYRDIVILLRTMSGWSEVFVDTLMSEGIPAYADTQTGYFETMEIKTILNLLKVIDNPRQDIPLAAVLRSPIANITSDELALIRVKNKEASLYEALLTYAYDNEEKEELENPQEEVENPKAELENPKEKEELKDKLVHLLERFEQVRKMIPYTPIHELLEILLKETGYSRFIQAMPAGTQRLANIDMLLQRALDFESSSYHGLFHFIRYIEKLQKYEIDYGEAGVASQNDDTVRIMSIHKSKGLEFPVCFVAGMGKNFNNQDTKARLVLHPELGLGPDYIDYELRTKTPTLLKKVMQKQLVLENLAEELRVLYVALTRAKEKLIITGYTKSIEKLLLKYNVVRKQKSKTLLFHQLSSAGTYLDWLVPSLIRHNSFTNLLRDYGIPGESIEGFLEDMPFYVRHIHLAELTKVELLKQIEQGLSKEELLEFDVSKVYDEKIKKELEEKLCYEYPYKKEEVLRSKISVSELKRLGQMIDEEQSEKLYDQGLANEEVMDKNCVPEDMVPKFMKTTMHVSGTDRGTLYHKVVECIRIDAIHSVEEAQKELDRLVKEAKIKEEDKKLINVTHIYQFAVSDLAKRMSQADIEGALYREQPFVLGIEARELYEDVDSKELILIQGIIDAYFEEDGELVLLDYKTDRVNSSDEEKLIERYKVQLKNYKRALEQLTGKNVKETYIYSFALGKSIEVLSHLR